MKLEFCTDDMFRVRHSQGTVFAENEQWMVRKYDLLLYTCLLYTSNAVLHEKVVRMVKRDRSHPCLVIYNMMNESGNADVYKRQV